MYSDLLLELVLSVNKVNLYIKSCSLLVLIHFYFFMAIFEYFTSANKEHLHNPKNDEDVERT